MDDKQFEKIHAAFVKSYNIGDGNAWYPSQRPFINLRDKCKEILDA